MHSLKVEFVSAHFAPSIHDMMTKLGMKFSEDPETQADHLADLDKSVVRFSNDIAIGTLECTGADDQVVRRLQEIKTQIDLHISPKRTATFNLRQHKNG